MRPKPDACSRNSSTSAWRVDVVTAPTSRALDHRPSGPPSSLVRLLVLKQLFDDVHRSVGTDFSNTHGEQPIEEVVLWRGCLESRQGAQVLSRIVADTSERQIDQRAV